MKLLGLTRLRFLRSGIFGILSDPVGPLVLHTLEHAYAITPEVVSASTSYTPKIPPGTYRCVRGMHRLAHMDHDFETFEVTGVEGHTNLLFHIGNFNEDSNGCILLGLALAQGAETENVLNSKEAFNLFMKELEGRDVFTLIVT